MSIGKPNEITKGWGHELIFASNDKYCGKILHINKGEKTSMHFHAQKDETWYVLSGEFKIIIINPQDASRTTIKFTTGMVCHIPKYCSHQIEAIETGDIIEVSTQDMPFDSYRVEVGSSQKQRTSELGTTPSQQPKSTYTIPLFGASTPIQSSPFSASQKTGGSKKYADSTPSWFVHNN